ncbi:GNAT family N-acetyltransferase [Pseudobacteriovorax antillogorgiicola]|uniref:Acetyltransferase (GNAT) domain-containing protein n=1 Tax=Pseudobacteriovorax antillogorgiicola TaxID=1513793 RepID=A0A1Y6BNV4_9BACT|nr:GNAT family N-acetyltransferase [Pseudobacteriovorax antillogorgiicola]TCS53888.1 acetyltransferase (GNAT) family protein [Pseudobacteriovorax antillogorgiicola]SMF20953.1 Acetyltransferase (GNAT) domain-containing protein [Pseudobacteriovorax antillogorgiicola]
MEIRAANQSELASVFATVHEAWPHHEDLNTHVSRRLASPQHQYATWYVVKIKDRIAASLGAYPMSFQAGGRVINGIAIGAVFTVKSQRKQGLAFKLIEQVHLRAQEQGATVSLLFSDISPAYYEKLGYHQVPMFHGQEAATSHDRLLIQSRPIDEFPRETKGVEQAHILHTNSHWQWLQKRHQGLEHYVVTDGSSILASFMTGFYEGRTWVLRWHQLSLNPQALKLALEHLAAHLDQPQVDYWWSGPLPEPSSLNLASPQAEIPMICSLDGEQYHHHKWQLEAIDHV